MCQSMWLFHVSHLNFLDVVDPNQTVHLELLSMYYLPQMTPTNVSAPTGVVWQTASSYSFYSVFLPAEWEAYAVTFWPVWVSVIM